MSWVVDMFKVRARKHIAVRVGGDADADYFREGLCWVLYDDVVNGRLLDMLCIGAWVIHNFCQGLAQVGSGCDGSFEACVWCVTWLNV